MICNHPYNFCCVLVVCFLSAQCRNVFQYACRQPCLYQGLYTYFTNKRLCSVCIAYSRAPHDRLVLIPAGGSRTLIYTRGYTRARLPCSSTPPARGLNCLLLSRCTARLACLSSTGIRSVLHHKQLPAGMCAMALCMPAPKKTTR